MTIKNIFKNTFLLLVGALLLSSCEDTVEIDTGFDTPQVVVDAWIDNRNQDQKIIITQTQDYFDNSVPAGITNAVVTVYKGFQEYQFIHTTNGEYVWSPNDTETLGLVGEDFNLQIVIDEKQYSSNTSIYRVPVIDSIGLLFEEESPIFEEGLYGEAYAIDFPGVGDTYWMKSFKNDTLLNKPLELNPIYDGTFEAGSGFDGVTFITPKRRAITPLDDDNRLIPFVTGDKIYVELHSISNEAFSFLSIAFQQITNSENTIFALPLANSKGNIYDDSTGDRILGVFNVAAVETKTRIVE